MSLPSVAERPAPASEDGRAARVTHRPHSLIENAAVGVQVILDETEAHLREVIEATRRDAEGAAIVLNQRLTTRLEAVRARARSRFAAALNAARIV